MPGKRVHIDVETWASVDLLAKDRMMSFQELFDEAIRDLLKKHKIPQSLREALSKSVNRRRKSQLRKVDRSSIKTGGRSRRRLA
jgi:hypothetical protein